MTDFWADKWNGWKITNEQADLINNGNGEARNRFYLDNLDRITRMARSFVQKHGLDNSLIEDMTQSVYLDMTLWTYQNGTPIKTASRFH